MSVNCVNALMTVSRQLASPFRIETPKCYVEEQMRCVDRAGHAVEVSKRQTGIFRFLYDCAAGNVLLCGITRPKVSKMAGVFLNSRVSALLIIPFIRRNGIDMSEYESGPFKSFNEFFCRNILPDTRKIDSTPASIISPCDGKVQVFPISEDSSFNIKGTPYTINSLLRNEKLAEQYNGGILVLLRLGVENFHRYVYPVNGRINSYIRIDGKLNTVNPYVASLRPIYSENSREYAIIETEEAGNVLMMEVGALLVGRIMNSHSIGLVRRGEEKGYFRFGASSIVLCFEKGMIVPDDDLVSHSENGEETIVRLGEHIAIAANIQRRD